MIFLNILLILYSIYCMTFCICIVHQLILEYRENQLRINTEHANNMHNDVAYLEEILPIINDLM
jgi:hypothetical protein